ncbi:hypothetical protein [Planktotalea sp.]|uniref:hypothetical protein n=1 Tax=Planktotalea sp. TaxID=2029877 RepID=UPI003D6C250C
MAYLKPQTLTCPDCGLSAEVKWVIGVGPTSKPGQTPSRRLHHIKPFIRDADHANTLICPDCGAIVT